MITKCTEGCGVVIQTADKELGEKLLEKHIAEEHSKPEQRVALKTTEALETVHELKAMAKSPEAIAALAKLEAKLNEVLAIK